MQAVVPGCGVLGKELEPDFSTLGELDRVGQQVEPDLLQAGWITEQTLGQLTGPKQH